MPSIWTFSDRADRGYGVFKRRLLQSMHTRGWTTTMAEAPLLEPQSKKLLRDDLFDRKPEWILLINQTAAQFYDYLDIPLQLRPYSIKKWVWFLDDPHFFVNRPFETEECVFSFDDTYLDFLRTWKPGRVGYFPLACDMDHAGFFDSRYSCEVCFVGGVIDQSSRRAQLSVEMQFYVDRLVDLHLQHRDKTFHQLAIENPISPGKQIQITPSVAHYLYWEANNRYRIGILEKLQDFDLRIYGNEDWERILENSPLRNRFYGPCDPVKELPLIFVSAKINLNLHSIQCRGSLNQRDFNAPPAGGFLLSDWVPTAGRFFVPGEEAVYWSGIGDLRYKIDYYLEHPEARQRIVQHGCQRVQRDHTYDLRVEYALEELGKNDILIENNRKNH